MKIISIQFIIFLILAYFIVGQNPSLAVAQSEPSKQWSTWRGPNNNGIVDGQKAVTNWSESKNVLWFSEIPGRGHSTPIIVDDRIFLTTSDAGAETQSVLCYQRDGGKLLWNKVVNKGNFNPKIYPKNTHASPTVACDGQRVFALFNNTGQNQLTALDMDGEILWQRHVAKFETKYPFGSGSTPILHNGLLYVPNETNAECAIIVVDPSTGKEVRRIDRGGKFSSYSTPVVAEVAGRTQLLISGGSKVNGYDPESGDELWSVPSKWQVSCGTMVWDGDMVYASGGFPAQQTLAINAKTGELVWDKPVKFYEQSMLVDDGRLYGLSDKGVVYCWDAKTGEEHFKQRFEFPVSASPVLVDGNIYFTSEKGNTLVIKAGTDEFVKVAKNKLGNSSFASFAVVDNKIYARVGFGRGNELQEYLYCLGTE
jgi:outer membrane protein assembly factor BamB